MNRYETTFNIAFLKYVFLAWLLTHRDPDLLDALISMIGRIL